MFEGVRASHASHSLWPPSACHTLAPRSYSAPESITAPPESGIAEAEARNWR
jgi:hypothetical protein